MCVNNLAGRYEGLARHSSVGLESIDLFYPSFLPWGSVADETISRPELEKAREHDVKTGS